MVNLPTKGVLQNKTKERSWTQVCVSKGEGLRTGFSLKMMDWKPDDDRACRKHEITYTKIEFGFANFMLKMMVEYSDKRFQRETQMWDQRHGNIYPSYLILFKHKFKEKTTNTCKSGPRH